MLGWLLNLVYALLLMAVSPMLLWRAVTQGKYRSGWGEKLLGRLPSSSPGERVVWLHAVSVGEVLQLRTLVPRLRRSWPDHTVLITTTTVTGHAIATETFPDCRIAYLPLDFTWAVRAALNRVRPEMLGLVELELWPNLIREASFADVPLLLINGRMSERSHQGYRRVRPLIAPLLHRFSHVAVQTEEYAERLIELGAPADRTTVTGSLKFDGMNVAGGEVSSDLARAFGIGDDETVFIAGSTHEPEESIALDAWESLRSSHPRLRLILVPRHKERFDTVAQLVESRGHALIRRSCSDSTPTAASSAAPIATSIPTPAPNDSAVCLLDTHGELSDCWRLADVAFVGGSLTSRGGQNMIEPAALGVPVVVGPNTSNFRDVVDGLRWVNGIRVIAAPDQLAQAVDDLLSEVESTQRMTAAAAGFVRAQQGATDRTLALIADCLAPATSSKVRAA